MGLLKLAATTVSEVLGGGLQALSGATITSKAVSDGANAAIAAVEKIKEAK